jgi:hypothetical protein
MIHNPFLHCPINGLEKLCLTLPHIYYGLQLYATTNKSTLVSLALLYTQGSRPGLISVAPDGAKNQDDSYIELTCLMGGERLRRLTASAFSHAIAEDSNFSFRELESQA